MRHLRLDDWLQLDLSFESRLGAVVPKAPRHFFCARRRRAPRHKI